MNEQVFPIAVAGAGDFGQKCLESLAGTACFRLVGVADRESRLAEQAGTVYGVPSFNDHRQLITQARPAVLLVATPPAVSAEVIRLAIKHGIHVVKPAPLARTLDEAVDLVTTAENAGLHLAVLAPRRFEASYRELASRRGALGPLFLGRAQYVLNWGRQFGWRGDQAGAGGGVLLEAGYQMIDLLVAAMGVPEEVYAVTGRRGRPHMIADDEHVENMGIYDTDDSAVVAMRYADGAAGSVVASWVTSPAAEQLILHGQRGSGLADPSHCVVRDADGQVVHRVEGQTRLTDALAEQFHCLAALLRGTAKTIDGAAREHLLTMAVVEAAYLSDRTGSPENPQALLRARNLTVEECRPGAGRAVPPE